MAAARAMGMDTYHGLMADDFGSTQFDRMLVPVDAVVQHVVGRVDPKAIGETDFSALTGSGG